MPISHRMYAMSGKVARRQDAADRGAFECRADRGARRYGAVPAKPRRTNKHPRVAHASRRRDLPCLPRPRRSAVHRGRRRARAVPRRAGAARGEMRASTTRRKARGWKAAQKGMDDEDQQSATARGGRGVPVLGAVPHGPVPTVRRRHRSRKRRSASRGRRSPSSWIARSGSFATTPSRVAPPSGRTPRSSCCQGGRRPPRPARHGVGRADRRGRRGTGDPGHPDRGGADRRRRGGARGRACRSGAAEMLTAIAGTVALLVVFAAVGGSASLARRWRGARRS